MALPTSAATSKELFEIAIETDGINLYESWEMKDCWAYWILPNGKILGSALPHDGMVNKISSGLPSFDQAHGYHYLNYHLHWIRARTQCPRRELNTGIFDAHHPVTTQQRKVMRDYVGLKDRDVILRIISDDSTDDVYLRGVKVGMYLGD